MVGHERDQGAEDTPSNDVRRMVSIIFETLPPLSAVPIASSESRERKKKKRLTPRPTDGDQRRPDQRRDRHPGFDRVTAVIKEVHLAREVQRKVAQPGPGDCQRLSVSELCTRPPERGRYRVQVETYKKSDRRGTT